MTTPHAKLAVGSDADDRTVTFLLLRRMTGRLWEPALVAAVFGLHPLRAESVVWISERKDVLSLAFALLTFHAYVRYAGTSPVRSDAAPVPRNRLFASRDAARGSPASRHRQWWYVASLLSFLLGLAAKPMLVSLPFLLVLLDFWPLRRLGRGPGDQPPGTTRGTTRSSLPGLVLEKLPFLALATASAIVTIVVQSRGGAVSPATQVAPGHRVANAVVSYVWYLWKSLWPRDLAPLYPHPNLPGGTPWSPFVVAGSALLLLGITVFVVRRGDLGYLRTGWFWYLGSLVPVIGLVQVGVQGVADRYSYLPTIGLWIAFVWGLSAAVRRLGPTAARTAVVLGLVVILGFGALASVQASCWRDSVTLYSCALARYPDSPVLRHNLGQVWRSRGEHERALAEFRAALRVFPAHRESILGYARTLAESGAREAALRFLEEAVRNLPRDAALRTEFAESFAVLGRLPEAERQYAEAIALDPAGDAESHFGLGNVLARQGRVDEALASYRAAVRIQPDSSPIHTNLAWALLQTGQDADALQHYREAVRLDPESMVAVNQIAWLLATHVELREPSEALRWALRGAELAGAPDGRVLETLAAAHAAASQFSAALDAARSALVLAESSGDSTQARRILEQIACYERGSAFTDRK